MKKLSPVVYGSVTAVVILIACTLIFIAKINQHKKAGDIDIYRQFIKVETARLTNRFDELQSFNNLLSGNPTIIDAMDRHLKGQDTAPDTAQIIRSLLDNISAIKHLSAAYLLDTRGICLFSSQPDFIGKNYSFRPYFIDTLAKKKPTTYMAWGVTSHKLGVYIAHPIVTGETTLGVAVLKIEPAFFDIQRARFFQAWLGNSTDLRTGLVTTSGIFVDVTDRKLYALEPLSPARIDQIRTSRQFPVNSIQNLSFPPGTWARLKQSGFLAQAAGEHRYYLFALPLDSTGLFLVHMADTSWLHSVVQPISGFYKALILVFVFMLAIACALIYFFDKRHRAIIEQSTSLAESENKLLLFSKAVEQSGNSIVITDSLGDIMYVNPHFTKVTGYTFEEVHGKNPRVLKSGTQDSSVYQELWQTLARGEIWRGVLHNKKKSGEFYWEEATISPILNSDGEVTHYIAIKEDISDRIALTQQLREEKEKLQLIIEHAGLGIAIIVNRIFSWVNQAGVDLFGYDSVDEVLGRAARILYPSQEIFLEVGKAAHETFVKRQIFKKELQLQKKDGTLFWAAITGKAMDPEHPDQGIIWIVEDIDQRKKDEEQLKQAKREAEEANTMKSRLLANISHDIRTPLHGILGTCSLLQAQPLGKEQQKLVTTGNRAAEFLLNLLNNLLDLSKIEAGQLVLDNYPFSIRKLLGEVGEILDGQFSKKSIAYQYHVASSIPEVLIGDALRIQQIFINLVGNSLKFTEQGSVSVSVTGETEENDNILLTCQVRDTGIGIGAEGQERLFEAFTQADNSITRKFGGSGLGLSICRELCTLMGGRIWFESREGKGTTFYFTLRCTIASDQSIAIDMVETDESTPSLTKPPPLTILIVDDNEANQNILRMMLESGGHQAHIAGNGLLALKKLAYSSFDLIFMDMQMPVMDGLTATRLIRECEAGRRPENTESVEPELLTVLCQRLRNSYTPIVALTANALQDDKRRCEEAGMDHFLVKPFRHEQLHPILAQIAHAPARESVERESVEERQANTDLAIPDIEAIRGFIRKRYPFSEEQITTLVTTTIKTISDDLELLTRHAEAGETGKTGEVAHKIKGSALNLGLEKFAETLSRLEEAAGEGDTATCQRELHELQIWGHRFRCLVEDN